jgi:hypothetical protein
MSEAWVSLVPCHADHGRRGMMLAAAAMVGCFIFGVGAGPIPLVVVAFATVTALWVESASARAAVISRSSRPYVQRVLVERSAEYQPPPAPVWTVVEVDGERRLELHWKRE